MIPYIVWSMIGILLFPPLPINFKGIVMIFITGNGPFYQLYYIPLLIQLLLLLPALLRLRIGKLAVGSLFFVTLFVCSIYQVLIIASKIPTEWLGWSNLAFQSTFLLWLLYFVSGLLAAKHYPTFVKWIKFVPLYRFIGIFAIFTIMLLIDAYLNMDFFQRDELYSYFRVTVVLFSCSAIALLMKLGMKRRSNLFSWLYEHSFGIYLVHVAVIRGIEQVSLLPFSNGLGIIVTTALTVVVSGCIVMLIKKSPLAVLLVGRK